MNFAYPYDPTGTNPECHIQTNEEYPIISYFNKWMCIIPNAAPFFRNDLIIRHKETNRELVEGVDYYLGHRFHDATSVSKQIVSGSIFLIDTSLTGTIVFSSYRTLGGPYLSTRENTALYLSTEFEDPRNCTWREVIKRNVSIPPLHVPESEAEAIKIDPIAASLDKLNKKLSDVTGSVFDAYRELNTKLTTLKGKISQYQIPDHIHLESEPHHTTAAQLHSLAVGDNAANALSVYCRSLGELTTLINSMRISQNDLDVLAAKNGFEILGNLVLKDGSALLRTDSGLTEINLSNGSITMVINKALTIESSAVDTKPIGLVAGKNILTLGGTPDLPKLAYNGATVITADTVGDVAPPIDPSVLKVTHTSTNSVSLDGIGTVTSPLRATVRFPVATDTIDGVVKITNNLLLGSADKAACVSQYHTLNELVLEYADKTTKVNGYMLTDDITLKANDFGLNAVSNISDLDLPLSKAVIAELSKYSNIGHRHTIDDIVDLDHATTTHKGIFRLVNDTTFTSVTDGLNAGAVQPSTVKYAVAVSNINEAMPAHTLDAANYAGHGCNTVKTKGPVPGISPRGQSGLSGIVKSSDSVYEAIRFASDPTYGLIYLPTVVNVTDGAPHIDNFITEEFRPALLPAAEKVDDVIASSHGYQLMTVTTGDAYSYYLVDQRGGFDNENAIYCKLRFQNNHARLHIVTLAVYEDELFLIEYFKPNILRVYKGSLSEGMNSGTMDITEVLLSGTSFGGTAIEPTFPVYLFKELSSESDNLSLIRSNVVNATFSMGSYLGYGVFQSGSKARMLVNMEVTANNQGQATTSEVAFSFVIDLKDNTIKPDNCYFPTVYNSAGFVDNPCVNTGNHYYGSASGSQYLFMDMNRHEGGQSIRMLTAPQGSDLYTSANLENYTIISSPSTPLAMPSAKEVNVKLNVIRANAANGFKVAYLGDDTAYVKVDDPINPALNVVVYTKCLPPENPMEIFNFAVGEVVSPSLWEKADNIITYLDGGSSTAVGVRYTNTCKSVYRRFDATHREFTDLVTLDDTPIVNVVNMLAKENLKLITWELYAIDRSIMPCSYLIMLVTANNSLLRICYQVMFADNSLTSISDIHKFKRESVRGDESLDYRGNSTQVNLLYGDDGYKFISKIKTAKFGTVVSMLTGEYANKEITQVRNFMFYDYEKFGINHAIYRGEYTFRYGRIHYAKSDGPIPIVQYVRGQGIVFQSSAPKVNVKLVALFDFSWGYFKGEDGDNYIGKMDNGGDQPSYLFRTKIKAPVQRGLYTHHNDSMIVSGNIITKDGCYNTYSPILDSFILDDEHSYDAGCLNKSLHDYFFNTCVKSGLRAQLSNSGNEADSLITSGFGNLEWRIYTYQKICYVVFTSDCDYKNAKHTVSVLCKFKEGCADDHQSYVNLRAVLLSTETPHSWGSAACTTIPALADEYHVWLPCGRENGVGGTEVFCYSITNKDAQIADMKYPEKASKQCFLSMHFGHAEFDSTKWLTAPLLTKEQSAEMPLNVSYKNGYLLPDNRINVEVSPGTCIEVESDPHRISFISDAHAAILKQGDTVNSRLHTYGDIIIGDEGIEGISFSNHSYLRPYKFENKKFTYLNSKAVEHKLSNELISAMSTVAKIDLITAHAAFVAYFIYSESVAYILTAVEPTANNASDLRIFKIEKAKLTNGVLTGSIVKCEYKESLPKGKTYLNDTMEYMRLASPTYTYNAHYKAKCLVMTNTVSFITSKYERLYPTFNIFETKGKNKYAVNINKWSYGYDNKEVPDTPTHYNYVGTSQHCTRLPLGYIDVNSFPSVVDNDNVHVPDNIIYLPENWCAVRTDRDVCFLGHYSKVSNTQIEYVRFDKYISLEHYQRFARMVFLRTADASKTITCRGTVVDADHPVGSTYFTRGELTKSIKFAKAEFSKQIDTLAKQVVAEGEAPIDLRRSRIPHTTCVLNPNGDYVLYVSWTYVNTKNQVYTKLWGSFIEDGYDIKNMSFKSCQYFQTYSYLHETLFTGNILPETKSDRYASYTDDSRDRTFITLPYCVKYNKDFTDSTPCALLLVLFSKMPKIITDYMTMHPIFGICRGAYSGQGELAFNCYANLDLTCEDKCWSDKIGQPCKSVDLRSFKYTKMPMTVDGVHTVASGDNWLFQILEELPFYINSVAYKLAPYSVNFSDTFPNNYTNRKFYFHVEVVNGVANYAIKDSILPDIDSRLYIGYVETLSDYIGYCTIKPISKIGQTTELTDHINDPNAHGFKTITADTIGLGNVRNEKPNSIVQYTGALLRRAEMFSPTEGAYYPYKVGDYTKYLGDFHGYGYNPSALYDKHASIITVNFLPTTNTVYVAGFTDDYGRVIVNGNAVAKAGVEQGPFTVVPNEVCTVTMIGINGQGPFGTSLGVGDVRGRYHVTSPYQGSFSLVLHATDPDTEINNFIHDNMHNRSEEYATVGTLLDQCNPAHGGNITIMTGYTYSKEGLPVPLGYTKEQCQYMLTPRWYDPGSINTLVTTIKSQVIDGVVNGRYITANNSTEYHMEMHYICIASKDH